MNNLYFICPSCKVFIDAGYRWAYWTLEDAGVVARDQTVDPQKVFAAEEYWNPEKDDISKWLYDEVFPSVRAFLEEHGSHDVVFDEHDRFRDEGGVNWFLEWIQEGFLSDPLPRFF